MNVNDYIFNEKDKYLTYHLDFVLDNNISDYHYMHKELPALRPCFNSYKTCKELKAYTLQPVIATFEANESLAEIIMQCSVMGFPVDFIYLKIKKENSHVNFPEYVTQKVIDTHTDDVSTFFDIADAPRYYIVKAGKDIKSYGIKWLIVDRFKQSLDVDFLHGKFDKKAIICAFETQQIAKEYLNSLNK